MRTFLLLFLLGTAYAATADAPPSDLAAKRDASLKTPEGASYEAAAKKVLASTIRTMLPCFAGSHSQVSIAVLFEVTPSGAVGAYQASPQGATTECIVKAIQAATFAPAPPNFVGSFSLLVPGHK